MTIHLAALLSAVCAVACTETALAADAPGGLVLARAGKSDYRIVLAGTATEFEKRAAGELQDYLRRITGATLQIVTDDAAATDHEIVVGRSKRLEEIGAWIDFRKLGGQGFTVKTVGSRLVIAGGPDHGALYGVYGFLEDHLGCRWYTPTFTRVPNNPDISIGRLNDTQVPKLVYREIFYGDIRNHAFEVRQKLNGAFLDNAGGGHEEDGVLPGFGGWAHSFFILMPPEKYFKDHPEYYALRDGKRLPTQLCLSNPDVLKIVVQNLREAMAKRPQTEYWTVSQADNGEPCQCPNCKAIDDREGAPSGSTLEFANKVAAFFPKKKISTLGYWYTGAPPKHLKPAKNVHVMYCTDTDRRPPLYDWYKGWAAIAPLRYHWYYVIAYHNMISPWPNFYDIKRDIKEWADGGMTGAFVEGAWHPGSEFAELRAYLIAKLLWNPDADASAIMDDFLNAFYGAAGPIIRKYIDTMYQRMVAAGDQLSGHDWCRNHATTFLAPDMTAKYDVLFDQAEKAVANDPELFMRVRHARLPLMQAKVQLHYGSVESRLATLYEMKSITLQRHISAYADESGESAWDYLAGVQADLERERALKH